MEAGLLWSQRAPYSKTLTCSARLYQKQTRKIKNVFKRHYTNIRFISPFILSVSISGATPALARARGQTDRPWHVMMATSAHVVIRVRMANVQRHLSLATRCVSTVTATTAVSKQALDLQAYARVRLEVCVPFSLIQ